MRLLIVILIFPLFSEAFTVFSSAHFEPRWSFVSKNVVSTEQQNPVYFEMDEAALQLDLTRWKDRRNRLDVVGDIEARRYDFRTRRPLIGRILLKVGDVRVLRESGTLRGSSVSFLYEGDIIETMSTGGAWIVLIDGSLLRLSPHSSISLSSFIFNSEKMQFYIRLNQGELYSKVRRPRDFDTTKERFSDLKYSPVFGAEKLNDILLKFNRSLYKTGKLSEQSLKNMLDLYLDNISFQSTKTNSSLVFYTNQIIVEQKDSVGHLFEVYGKTFFKFYGENFSENKEVSMVSFEKSVKNYKNKIWYEAVPGELSETDFMKDKELAIKLATASINPIFVLREKFLEAYGHPYFNFSKFPTLKYSNSFWGDQIEKREQFVDSYFRRTEASFRIVKNSREKKAQPILTQQDYFNRYHFLTLRLRTLKNLGVLKFNEYFSNEKLMSNSYKSYKNDINRIKSNILKKISDESANFEYLSRQ